MIFLDLFLCIVFYDTKESNFCEKNVLFCEDIAGSYGKL